MEVADPLPSTPSVDDDAVTLLATLKRHTTESTSTVAEGKAARHQTNRQRRVFHTLHSLHQALLAEGRAQLQVCEQGLVDTFARMLRQPDLHHALTAATSQIMATLCVLLLSNLYSKPAADFLANHALELAQARGAPRNVRLCAAVCLGRALGSSGHQLRQLHAGAVTFLSTGLRATEACIREACLGALSQALSGCGSSIAAQHKAIFQAVRGLSAGDKSADVRAAAGGTLASLSGAQAALGGDKAFGGGVRLSEVVEALKRGLLDKLPCVAEAHARALASVLATTCPDEVSLPSTRHLAHDAAYADNANARFHLLAKTTSARGGVTPLANAVDFAVSAITKPGFLGSGVGQFRSQAGGGAALTHLLRTVGQRLAHPAQHQHLRVVLDRVLSCLDAAAMASGASSPSDAVHSAALCARAFRRGFTSVAGEAQQLALLELAVGRVLPKTPGKRAGGSGGGGGGGGGGGDGIGAAASDGSGESPVSSSAARLFVLREANYVMSCLGAGAVSLVARVTAVCRLCAVDPEPLVRHAAVEVFVTLTRLLDQDALNATAEELHSELIMAQAQVSAIAATQSGRAKLDHRSAYFGVTGHALLLHAVLLRLAAHPAPSERTRTLLIVVSSVARSLINQTQGVSRDAALSESTVSCSWGGWILLAGVATFAYHHISDFVGNWLKTWVSVLYKPVVGSDGGGGGGDAGDGGGDGGDRNASAATAELPKLTPQQAETIAQRLVPAATMLLCFCQRHRDHLALSATSSSSLCNSVLKIVLAVRTRVCRVVLDSNAASGAAGPQTSASLLHALLLSALAQLPVKRYAPAHKQLLIDAVQLFADKVRACARACVRACVRVCLPACLPPGAVAAAAAAAGSLVLVRPRLCAFSCAMRMRLYLAVFERR
jgi:hypothetical protein